MKRKRYERLYAALSPNGHRVHIANSEGQPACGSQVFATYRVHARVTCALCAKRRPKKAKQFAERPLVVGIDHSPFYAAMSRALEAGATEEPAVKVAYWPVLA